MTAAGGAEEDASRRSRLWKENYGRAVADALHSGAPTIALRRRLPGRWSAPKRNNRNQNMAFGSMPNACAERTMSYSHWRAICTIVRQSSLREDSPDYEKTRYRNLFRHADG